MVENTLTNNILNPRVYDILGANPARKLQGPTPGCQRDPSMQYVALSRMGVRIRLTETQWTHIIESHSELIELRSEILETVERADTVLAGGEDELLAVRERIPGKWIVVVYKELNDDGFIITAYLTSKEGPLRRRRQLWP